LFLSMTAVGWLVARAAVAYVFLYAGWMNTRDAASRDWTVGQTALILGFIPEARRHQVAILCAILGMVMMYGGGVSVLLGLEGRAGAVALIVFSALGMAIHRANREQALKIANDLSTDPAVKDRAQALGWSAYGAHLAAGLKNVALIGVNVLFLLDGAGGLGPWAKPWAISDALGRFVQ
jgi:uncharacterized membrane protein YphA (DoxX/SURF4 family)